MLPSKHKVQAKNSMPGGLFPLANPPPRTARTRVSLDDPGPLLKHHPWKNPDYEPE